MTMEVHDSESDDEIPFGWEEKVSPNNRIFYVNHSTKTTQWYHPINNKRYMVDAELPKCWQQRLGPDGQVAYFNTETSQTVYTDPRLAFSYQVTDKNVNHQRKHKSLNASSTTDDVLGDINLIGSVAIVTGANCGIGYETAKALASRGAHVIMACRNEDRAKEAIESIKTSNLSYNFNLTYIHCDLSSLESVRNFCQTFLQLKLPINILVLNAAINAIPYKLTGDNIEMTFQVNHLSHFYMTHLLENKLIESAPSRVVVVSSESHRFSTINSNNIEIDWTASTFVSFMAYNDSKLCNILFAKELHRRLYRHNVTVVSCHPGNLVYTNLQRQWWLLRLLYLLASPFTKSANQGAATVVYCAVSPEIEGQGGLYYNNCKPCSASSQSKDEALARLLWNRCHNMIANIMSE